MRALTLFCLSILISHAVTGQAYFSTMGIRVGPSNGISIQQRILERITAEIVVSHSIPMQETRMMLVGKLHNSLITKNANLFVGGGIHRTHSGSRGDQGKAAGNGILGLLGAELTIGRVNFSWDYRPSLHLSGLQSRILSAETAFYVRYIIIKRLKDLQKRKRKKNRAGSKNDRN